MKTTQDFNVATRSLEVVEMEVAALNTLIEKRNRWLAEPENRKKTTYTAVKKDTMQMIFNYKELVTELNELKK